MKRVVYSLLRNFGCASTVSRNCRFRRDTPDAVFLERPFHAQDCILRGRGPGGHLLEHWIIETRHHRAGIGRAAIDPDSEAERAAIGGDAPVIRDEVVFRILGRDPALQGMALEADIGLRWNAGFLKLADPPALSDADLRFDDIKAGDLLGDRVFPPGCAD